MRDSGDRDCNSGRVDGDKYKELTRPTVWTPQGKMGENGIREGLGIAQVLGLNNWVNHGAIS